MGAANSICRCCYYEQHDQEEKNAILTMNPPRPPVDRQPSTLSESSDSDPEVESLFGPGPLLESFLSNQEKGRSLCSRQGKGRSLAQHIKPSPFSSRKMSDAELQAFINLRDQTDQNTEEWEKLNYDIHTLRYTRREVSARWKKILLQLGYQCEVESLLCVNKQSQAMGQWEELNRASELLQDLLDHTALFPPGISPQERYLHVMDRLVSLDSAEDFIRLAKEKYPKTYT